jgi:hypothetical protein
MAVFCTLAFCKLDFFTLALGKLALFVLFGILANSVVTAFHKA